MAGSYLSAYPYRLDYLCSVGGSLSRFHEKTLIPLCWFGFGSVKELLELPISLLNRYVVIMEGEDMFTKFTAYKNPSLVVKG